VSFGAVLDRPGAVGGRGPGYGGEPRFDSVRDRGDIGVRHRLSLPRDRLGCRFQGEAAELVCPGEIEGWHGNSQRG
jgi:hypothetical protein